MTIRKKTALITGCTKGIGLAIVQKLANEGFNIAGCARNKHDLLKLYKQLSESHLEQSFFLEACDVADVNEVKQFANDATKEFSFFDILVNNAGVFIPGQIHNETEGTFETMINTNLASAYHVTRAILPKMVEQKNGHIFNICSTASITAYTNGGSYCISKFGMLGMSKVLREELKPYRIKVTAVLPGATFTNSWSGSTLPETRFIKPKHIAELVYNAYQIGEYSNVEEIIVRPVDGDIN
ncbi:MAG: SDR family oxidoreductase [Bacteroidia bacterium]